ncbi:hypothetical protein TcasGA2_TC014694 [Tribolium castaneum]|uniref:Uncharacterized protein n=1 Tax=Tribolium castaneum TaxID=7070 RepID=D6WNW4_TRICA|nr:hypothetical protein TcasGA2_TC014694 [Tribolium castaneum]
MVSLLNSCPHYSSPNRPSSQNKTHSCRLFAFRSVFPAPPWNAFFRARIAFVQNGDITSVSRSRSGNHETVLFHVFRSQWRTFSYLYLGVPLDGQAQECRSVQLTRRDWSRRRSRPAAATPRHSPHFLELNGNNSDVSGMICVPPPPAERAEGRRGRTRALRMALKVHGSAKNPVNSSSAIRRPMLTRKTSQHNRGLTHTDCCGQCASDSHPLLACDNSHGTLPTTDHRQKPLAAAKTHNQEPNRQQTLSKDSGHGLRNNNNDQDSYS